MWWVKSSYVMTIATSGTQSKPGLPLSWIKVNCIIKILCTLWIIFIKFNCIWINFNLMYQIMSFDGYEGIRVIKNKHEHTSSLVDLSWRGGVVGWPAWLSRSGRTELVRDPLPSLAPLERPYTHYDIKLHSGTCPFCFVNIILLIKKRLSLS